MNKYADTHVTKAISRGMHHFASKPEFMSQSKDEFFELLQHQSDRNYLSKNFFDKSLEYFGDQYDNFSMGDKIKLLAWATQNKLKQPDIFEAVY